MESIDGLRGLAVVAMVALHSAHGYLRPDLKHGPGWDLIQRWGGMAAPLFFALAGAAAALAWERNDAVVRAGPGVRRGLSLMCLGYALRVQMWLIDGAALVEPAALAAGLALLVGDGLLYDGLVRRPSRLGLWARVGAAPVLLGAGLCGVQAVEPGRAVGLLRVDVLQGIGASLCVVALVAHGTRSPAARRGRLAAAAGLLVVLTPALQPWLPGRLPEPLAAYLGAWSPAPGQRTMGLFPLLPWGAYACLGAAFGPMLARALAVPRSPRAVLAVLGMGLGLGCTERRSFVYALLQEMPDLTVPVRVVERVALGVALAAAVAAVQRARPAAVAPLVKLGRHSLLVYWVHLELAFGAPATPLRGRLDGAQWAVAAAALGWLMWALAGQVERAGWAHFWAAKAARKPPPRTVGGAAKRPRSAQLG